MAVKRVSRKKLECITWSHHYGSHLLDRGFDILDRDEMVDIQSSMGYTAAVGSMLVDEVAMCVDKVNLHRSTSFLVDLIGDSDRRYGSTLNE